MTELSSSQFSFGLSSATGLRTRLLEALGAEPEWTAGTEDSIDVVWLAGPAPTFLSVQEGGALTPGLAVLTVRTRCAWVENLDQARWMVEDLNVHTTLNRWVVLGDPGPEGWFDSQMDDQAPDWMDTESLRRGLISSRPAPDAPVSVEVAVSFVVGDVSTDVPFGAVVLAVSEQIAKATALVTNDFAEGWGEATVADIDGRQRGGNDWNHVVYHYDNHVSPRASDDATPLLLTLNEAFAAEQAAQFEYATAAWYGGGDGSGFTCEVPYGPGPFDEGVIGMTASREIPLTDENRTSLVTASLVENPHAGKGLLITMRVPGDTNADDPPWWQASMLNAQSRLNRGGASPGMAHGFGAWALHEDEPQHVVFIPASWANDLPREELVPFFRQVLANFSRLSWAARRVMEQFADVEVSALLEPDEIPLSGLASGPLARGPQFGEPGVGTDAGAEVLAFTWKNLVGPDAEWAQLLNDPEGFEFWPNDHMQRITTTSCSCADPGSRITIDTPLLWGSTPETLHEAMRVQAEGWPAALVSNGQGLIARNLLHVHDDSKEWAQGWPIALAVAQALLAEHVDHRSRESVPWTSDHPQSGRRHDRDQMLTLFDAGQEWLDTPDRPLNPEALALAATFPEFAPYALAWREGSVLMDWSIDISFLDDSTRTSTVRTTYGPYEHPALGLCLRISTNLQVDVEDPESWCLENNEQLTSGPVDTFVLGGFATLRENHVAYITVVPVSLDRSTSIDRHAGFIGTNLHHHVSAVASLLMHVEGVEVPELTTALVADGYSCLAEFYRQSGLDIPPGLSTVLTEADLNSHGALTVFRPWSLPGQISEWPQMGAFDQEIEPLGIRTVVPLEAMPLWLAARFAQAAILGAAKARADGGTIGPPLSTVTHPLDGTDMHDVLGSLIGDEVLCFDEHRGELIVSPIESGIVLSAEYAADHPGWGNVLAITAVCPGTGEDEKQTETPEAIGDSLQIGDWHRDGDALKYRVCLPPLAFVTPYLEVRKYLFKHAVRSVAEHAKRSLEQPGPVRRAQALAMSAHDGQVDKAGRPYIEHPERVVGHLLNPTAQETVVAWLHDVVEDAGITLEYLENEFGSEVATAVDAITNRPGETKTDYYSRVRANPIALTVKAADLADNTDPARLELLDPNLRARLESKYALARHELGIE